MDSANNQKEFYLKDISGRDLGICDPSGAWTWYAYGHTNIGKLLYEDLSVFVKDHLGSNRITYKVSGCGSVFTLNHLVDYYAYGKTLREFISGNKEKFEYAGKERDQENGYDYLGARFYDSDVARFLSLDPHSDTYLAWTPYNYVLGNPIRFIDPLGMDPAKPKQGEKDVNGATYDEAKGWTLPTVEVTASRYGSNWPYQYSWSVEGPRGVRVNGSGNDGPNEGPSGISVATTLVGAGDTYYGYYSKLKNSYTTAKGETKHLLKANGEYRSIKAKQIGNTIKGVGTGLSMVNIILSGSQLYDQYVKGGKKNVNPVDATAFGLGVTGLTASTLTWTGVGGALLPIVAEVSGVGGMLIGAGQTWWQIYQPINDMVTAPQSTGNLGADFQLQMEYNNGFHSESDYFMNY